MIRLRRRYYSESVFSYSNKDSEDEIEPIISKWTIVRQRLPDILAMSTTYKPTSFRAQLMLLVAMMNRQTNELNTSSHAIANAKPARLPRTVSIKIDGRRQYINLKRIPPEQVIHVDVEGFSFSIPTRQLILAISRGDAHETAAKYCPPAISELLINLSKTKVVDDGLQYKRALYKTRIGQTLYFGLFMFMVSMIFMLMISATNTLFALSSLNGSMPHLPIDPESSSSDRDYFLGRNYLSFPFLSKN